MKAHFYIYGILFVVLIVVTGCKKDELQNKSEIIVFGEFRGFCGGERCIEIFRLETDQIFEDSNDTYPNSLDFYVGNWQLLSTEQFLKVKDLKDFFPSSLKSENRKVIGTPDSFDQGGYYIEYKTDDFHNFWIIDQDRKVVPVEYHEFLNKITEKVTQLQ